MMCDHVFSHFRQALDYYNAANPVRVKSLNILEPESRRGSTLRHGLDSGDIFSTVLICLRNTLNPERHPNPKQRGSPLPSDHRVAFALRHFGDRQSQLHPKEIARFLGVSHQSVYRWIEKVEMRFAAELLAHDLVSQEHLTYLERGY
jgi:hypothetical protein